MVLDTSGNFSPQEQTGPAEEETGREIGNRELPILTAEPDHARALELRDVLPEGVDFGYRQLPDEERGSPFYTPEKKYLLYEPGEIDEPLLAEVLNKHGLTAETPVLVLPFGERNKIGWETRRLYFALALTTEGMFNSEPVIANKEANYRNLPVTRIISFGDCNVACPYCKRDCQFIDERGKPIISMPVPIKAIAQLAAGATARNETIRFSGGDPVVYPKQTRALAEYLAVRHGAKVSIAHNGSGPRWVEKMLPYLSSAAIDLKAVPEKIGHIMGIPKDKGARMYQLSLETQRLISRAKILLDTRTPIFGDTTSEEMLRLAEDISKTNDLAYTFWTWRLYKPVAGCDWSIPKRENTIEMMLGVSREFPDLWMGMRAKWEKGGMLYVRDGHIIDTTPDVTEKDILEMGSGNGIKIAA